MQITVHSKLTFQQGLFSDLNNASNGTQVEESLDTHLLPKMWLSFISGNLEASYNKIGSWL